MNKQTKYVVQHLFMDEWMDLKTQCSNTETFDEIKWAKGAIKMEKTKIGGTLGNSEFRIVERVMTDQRVVYSNKLENEKARAELARQLKVIEERLDYDTKSDYDNLDMDTLIRFIKDGTQELIEQLDVALPNKEGE